MISRSTLEVGSSPSCLVATIVRAGTGSRALAQHARWLTLTPICACVCADWSGSLTTPPCSEGVAWNLLKRTSHVCQRQLDRLRTSLGALQEGVDVNNRVVQPTNGRIVSQTTPAATAADARADGSPASDAVAAAGWGVATNFGQLVGDAILLFTVVILMYGAARYVAQRVDDSRRRRMRMAEMAETPSETLSDAEDYM